MILDLIKKNRSYRKYDESVKIETEMLEKWVSAARYTAASLNVQSLKYILVNSREVCEQLFNTLTWAAYLTDWKGPKLGERPTAYAIQLLDTSISNSSSFDEGLHASAITLSAVEDGFGTCIFKGYNKKKLNQIFNFPLHLKLNSIIAFGKPIEEVRIVDMENGNYKYWRDENDVHYVPKRKIEELIIKKYY